MGKRSNNHTTAILVLIGITAAVSIAAGCILWFAGNQAASYTENFAADMTQYDGTGLVDGYAVITDVFGVWGSVFAAALVYALAMAAALYAVWAIIFMILNWALRLSYIGCRVANTVYSLPALAGGIGTLFSNDSANASVGLSVILLLYGGIILVLAYTSRVTGPEGERCRACWNRKGI